MTWWWGILSTLVLAASWLGLRRWRHRRRHRDVILDVLQAIAGRLEMDAVQIKSYPALHLTGRYCSYSLTVECVARDSAWLWRVHAELERHCGERLLLHGEGRPAKMRELYGMDVLLTDDPAFDRMVVTACTHDVFARRLLTNYLRSRFTRLQQTHFQIDIRDHTVYAEYLTSLESAPTALPPFLEIVVTMMAMIDVVTVES